MSDTIAAQLRKLRFKRGQLARMRATLANGVKVRLCEPNGRMQTDPRSRILLEITFTNGTTLLLKTDTLTAGRSIWFADNAYRLAEPYIERMAHAIASNPEGRAAS